MAAFARAVALGYRYLETDVHATRDGVAVVFHDETTDRMLGRPGRIEDLTLGGPDVGAGRRRGRGAAPGRPARGVAGPVLNIDVKADGASEPTRRRRCGAPAPLDRVLLASFSDGRLARVRAGWPGRRVATSLGERGGAALWLASRHGRGGGRGPGGRGAGAGAVPGRAVDDRGSSRTRTGSGWRCTSGRSTIPSEMRDLLDLGVDGIMTDHIDVLRDVYAERGLWPA